MATYNNLPDLFGAIADSIRSKTGGSAEIVADAFPTAIDGIVVRPRALIKQATGNGQTTLTVNAGVGEDLSVYNRVTVMLSPSGSLTFSRNSVVGLVMLSPAKADITYADTKGALAYQTEGVISASFSVASVSIDTNYAFFAGQPYAVVLWRY